MREKRLEQIKKHSPWMVLVTVMIGAMLVGIDNTVVNLGRSEMMEDFSISVSTSSWISIAYIIAEAIFVPVFGKLGDMIGDRKIYLGSLVGFVVISLLAGFSWNISALIFFRALQGLAGSAILPTSMSLITKSFSNKKDRAQALGIWSASFAASAVIGPLVGGPLIDNFSWRMLFYVNLPIGIVGIFMTLIFLSNDKGKEKGGFDFYGAITLSVALTSLVLVLEKGLDWGWTSRSSLLAYALIVIFGLWFIKIEKKHSSPMIDLKFFKNVTFTSALLVTFISFGGMMGAMFLIPVFVQVYMGYNATETGFLFLPMALSMFAAAPIGAKLSQKIHVRYCVSLGMLVTAFGIYLFTGLDSRISASELIVPLMFIAFGMGTGMSPLTNAATSSVPVHEVGVASAVLSLTRNIAGAVGIAAFGTLLNEATKTNVLELGANAIINDKSLTSVISALVVLKSQIIAYREVFLAASIVTTIGAFVALSLGDSSKIKDEETEIVQAEEFV